MGQDEIPVSVREFLAEHVRSLMSLELLLLMWRDASREWTTDDLKRELRCGSEWPERELARLLTRGLVARINAEVPRFRYAELNPRATEALQWLAESYPERRFSIIQLILSTYDHPIQSFAEAFKLRKENPRE